ncbi:shikimate kinase [Atopobium sp. oral taxon 416]|uniref:shikimate kinase n=1 Tax=Atopobium sp. oral taxon 416 TaxID=712157 RepID=UPI001BAAA485|nr:shikimate kinase [Atopobium sp. oral taxon 416]QUC02307.1 shikimate kinase [Atopobium sp. oral taxon 416]
MDTSRHTFGLIGHPLGHSWSPLIHKQLGSTPYDLIELEPDEVEPFLKEGDWKGLNVTIPYKEKAAQLADVTTERVKRTGAANTLVKDKNGRIVAENTDVLGFEYLLERFCTQKLYATSTKQLLQHQDVLVLGSGGASKAVQAALEDLNVHVSVISRRGEDTYATITQKHSHVSLIVNTTPVGMYPNCPKSPLDQETLAAFPELFGVLDVVYNPRRTKLCMLAESIHLPSESGLAMLIAQAFHSSTLFQDKDLDDSLIETIENTIVRETENLILIGMPGSGKTSTGKHLAHLLHRPFLDMDQAFTMEFGISPATFIETKGEASFRELETSLLAKSASRPGMVISCGGGVVTRPENYELLHQNGRIIMLNRPLIGLETDGRPISQRDGIAKLAETRMPLYRGWADFVIRTTGTPKGDVEAILSRLKSSAD